MKNKKIILLILLLTGIMFYNSTTTITTTKQLKKENNNELEIFTDALLNVYKTDENDHFLTGVTFKLKSYNDVFEWTLEESENLYIIDELNSKNISDINKILSNSQQKLVNSLKTVGDVQEKVKSYDGPYSFTNEDNTEEFGIEIYLPTVFTLEEAVAPTGYIKEKVYIPGGITLYYKVISIDETNPDNSPIELVGGDLMSHNNSMYLPYDDYNEEDILGIDFDINEEYWKKNSVKLYEQCSFNDTTIIGDYDDLIKEADKRVEIARYTQRSYMKKYNGGNHDEANGNADAIRGEEGIALPVNPGNSTGDIINLPICQINLKNIKGEVNLKVENKVNETTSLTTTNNTNLTYKVILKNTGNVDAIDNTLTSKIPEGFEYIEGSASNGGVYSNGEVVWDVKRVNKGEEKTFTFRVHVPKGTDLSKDYIGESSVTNSNIQNKVNSEKTVVKLSLINPNTLAPIALISVVLISLLILIYQFVKQKRKQTTY